MRKKIIYFLIILAMFLSSCAANGGKTNDSTSSNPIYNPSDKDVLSIYAVRYDTLNPLITAYSANRDMLSLVYEPLFYVTQNYSIEPRLAESFAISESGSVLTLTLRDGLYWHSGEKLTAADVDYTIKQILNYPDECVYKNNLADVESAYIIDERTYQIRLSRANAGFVYLLDFPIIQRSEYDIISTKDNFYTNGNGMYKISAVDKFASITLTANESWWGGGVNIKQINVGLLPDNAAAHNGFALNSIDVAVQKGELKDEYILSDNIGYKSSNNNRYTFLSVNHNSYPLSDVRLRKLVKRMALEDKIVNELLLDFSIKAYTPVNPMAVFAANFEYEQKDIKEELDILGYKQGDSGIRSIEVDGETYPLDFTMLVNEDSPSKVVIGEYLANSMITYGISIKLVKKPEAEYKQAALENVYDFVLCETKISPDNDLSFLIGTEGNLNFGGYSDEETDSLIEQISQTESIDLRNVLLAELQRKFAENMPHIPLYFASNKTYYNIDAIEEITDGALNFAYSNINTWRKK